MLALLPYPNAARQEPELANRFLNRHRELRLQRRRFRTNQLIERDNATQLYA